ncbi:hypothetical protein ACJ41O_008803 [Fusarium nematophilum]
MERLRDEVDKLKLDLQQARADRDQARRQLKQTVADLEATRAPPPSTGQKRPRITQEQDVRSTSWTRAIREGLEMLGQLPVAERCSLATRELVPRLWQVLERADQYKRLARFAGQGAPYEWRCVAALTEKGLEISRPLTAEGCSRHAAGECLQVRVVEEDGELVLDFRMG